MILALAFSMLTGVEATLVTVQGKVEAAAPGSEYRSAKQGETLAEGSRVRTGPQSEATLQLNDGSMLKLRERSEMQVASIKRQESSKTAVLLFFGRLWSKVAKTGGNNFDIVTPTSVAGVRGTEFTTAAGEDGATRVEVDEGNVAVDNEKEKASVGPGQQVDSNGEDVGSAQKKSDTDWNKWQAEKRQNLQKNGESLARGQTAKINERRAEIERLVKRQRALKEEYKEASDARKAEIKKEVEKNAIRLGELGVRASGQFGQFEHWGELAEDPDFGAKFFGAGFVRSELKRMRAVRADLEKMVAEGTDMSMKSLDKMMDDMKDGKKTIKDKKGGAKDLFDE